MCELAGEETDGCPKADAGGVVACRKDRRVTLTGRSLLTGLAAIPIQTINPDLIEVMQQALTHNYEGWVSQVRKA
jgi:hypothetical protein